MYHGAPSSPAQAGLALLSAVIVDDEQRSRNSLATLLREHCPEIHVVGQADSATSARSLILARQPDVLFLDIRMPGTDGFDLLESVRDCDCFVVFVTAHDKYGIRAIKASAIDYLLKPVSIRELQSAVDRLVKLRSNDRKTTKDLLTSYRSALLELTRSLRTDTAPQRIVLPTDKSLLIEELGNIVRAESHNNYITIVRNQGRDVVLSRSLTEFESILDDDQFIRIHNSHIVNLEYLVEFETRDGGFVVLRDGTRLPVSRRRQPSLIGKIKRYRHL